MTPVQIGVAFAAGFGAGAINSVAGGGTLVSFPALVWLGLPAVAASATNTVAIFPGSLGSMWGYRAEMQSAQRRWWLLLLPSLFGGILGAILLRWTPPGLFERLVPFLILFATLLFLAQEPIQKRLKTLHPGGGESQRWLVGALVFQFFVALYGGYFGAGMGILMLAALSIMGLSDIHQMNGLKNLFALAINGIAALYFIAAGMVDWPSALVMMVGAIAGGYLGAGVARRIGRVAVKRSVIVIGLSLAVILFVRTWLMS